MTTTVDAVYEEGLLRLMEPVALPEGTEVEVTITTRSPARNGKTPAEILKEIASIPLENGGPEFSGRDHDSVLYGQKGAR